MGYIEAIILGIIQGLTEFLPVSSSGHLEIAKVIFGDNSLPQDSLTFTVILHFATALSTIVVFRKDIMDLIKGILQFKWNDEVKFTLKIIVSMLPAVFVGLLFEEQFEQFFTGQILLVGFMLIITSLLLLYADRAKNTSNNVTFLSAFVIGISQALAILPGISRSGATISSSVLLGVNKTDAARFSFLMVLPLIFGKIGKDLISNSINFSSEQIVPLSLGFVASFIAGLLACKWMISIVRKSKLSYFSLYCFVVGVIAIAITLMQQ